MSSTYPRRKTIRLPGAAYADPSAVCSITIVTRERLRFFEDDSLAAACMALLADEPLQGRASIHAYCLMPDHLHLLLSPASGSSLVDFVREFKGLSTRLAREHEIAGAIWQRSFFDRFLRSDEAFERVVRYVLENPVRAGIVVEAGAYPFSGPWPALL